MGRRFYDGRETFQNLKTFNGGFSCKCKKFRQNKNNKKDKKSFPWTRYDVPQLIILASSSHGINIEKDFTELHGKRTEIENDQNALLSPSLRSYKLENFSQFLNLTPNARDFWKFVCENIEPTTRDLITISDRPPWQGGGAILPEISIESQLYLDFLQYVYVTHPSSETVRLAWNFKWGDLF